MRRLFLPLLSLAFNVVAAGQFDPRLYAGLQWRNIGPFRGGRVSAVAAVVAQGGGGGVMSWTALNTALGGLLTTVEDADIAVTEPQTNAYRDYCQGLTATLAAAQTARQAAPADLSAQLPAAALPAAPSCTIGANWKHREMWPQSRTGYCPYLT